MASRGGLRWREIGIIPGCVAAGLVGWVLVTSALLGLGVLIPYTTYSYNFQFDALVIELAAGSALIAVSLLIMALSRRVIAAWMLAGFQLALSGLVLINEACTAVVGLPIGASPSSSCDPGFAVAGFAVCVVGAGMIVSGLLRLRGARTRSSFAAYRPR